MNYTKASQDVFAVLLDPGDDIHGSLLQLAKAESISSAAVRGIGSIENPVLAHYNIEHKKYSEKSLSGIFELTSIEGNISIFEEKPLTHLHVSLSNDQMQAFGGHLVSGKCSATAEIFVHKLPSTLSKQQSERVGLKVWDLPN